MRGRLARVLAGGQKGARIGACGRLAGCAIAALAVGAMLSSAAAQPPGNGVNGFDDLRELNNKFGRAISSIRGPVNDLWDPAALGRTLKDLEVTKLRAVDQFPEILDPPYA